MQRKLLKIFMWVTVLVTQLYAEPSFEGNSAFETPQLEECIISTQDLLFDQQMILANINGVFYPVYSLENRENQWIAKLAVNYCPTGHPTCKQCGQCHKEKCRYYVRPCKQWE